MKRLLVLLAACSSPAKPPAAPADPEPVGPPDLPPVEAGALTWDATGLAAVAVDGPIAIDGDRLVWSAPDGAVRAAPRGGGEAAVVLHLEYVSAIAAADGIIYVLGDHALWAVPPMGEPTRLAELYSPDLLAVGADAIYVADGDWIRAVPRAGGEPITLATGAGVPVAITSDATHVYWADGGNKMRRGRRIACPKVKVMLAPGEVERPHPESTCESEQRFGTIRRVPIGGGAVQSRHAYYPTDVATHDGKIYWSDSGGEAAMRAGPDGNHVEVVLPGRGEELTVDATSTVVHTKWGAVIEVPADGGFPRLLATSVGLGDLAMSDDAVYVGQPEVGIQRVTRGGSRMTIIAVPTTPIGKIDDLVLDGDWLYLLDVAGDRSKTRVTRVPTAGGAAEVVREQDGNAWHLGVDGDHTLTDLDLDLGADVEADDLATDDRYDYWLVADAIFRRPHAGGEAERIYLGGKLYGYAASNGRLIVAGDHVVAASDALPGAIRVDLRPPKAKKGKPPPPLASEVLVPGASDVARAGDHVLAWREEQLMVVPGNRVIQLDEPDYRLDITADAHDAWAIVNGDLLHVPLDGSAPDLILPGAGQGELAVDADAIYFASDNLDGVLRIAR